MATITGTAQNDSLVGATEDDSISGGAGNDTLNGNDGADTLSGEAGDDLLIGGNGPDLLIGADGNDILWGGLGDTLRGGAGNDIFKLLPEGSIYFTNSITISDFTRGEDRIDLSETGIGDLEMLQNFLSSDGEWGTRLFANTTQGGVSMLVGVRPDQLAASDFIFAESQTPRNLVGNSHDDDLIGGAGNDTLDGGTGGGFDRMFGGAGDDLFILGTGQITLEGGAGADIFQLGLDGYGIFIINDFTNGVDKIDLRGTGISSFDLVKNLITDKSYHNASFLIKPTPHGKTIILNNMTETKLSYEDFIFDSEIVGRYLIGADGGDIYGGLGHDTLIGGTAADRLFGDAGDDVLIGGRGHDTLVGGNGADIFVLSGSSSYHSEVTIADFNYGVDKLDVSALGINSFDLLKEIVAGARPNNLIDLGERLVLTGGSIDWSRLAASDVILAADLPARNMVSSRDGSNLIGGSGNDTLTGGAGSQRILGGAGDDRLVSLGGGVDAMHGGAGNDLFVIASAGGTSLINDFTVDADRIDLSGLGIAGFETLQALLTDATVNGREGSLLTLTRDYVPTRVFISTPKAALTAGDIIFSTDSTPLVRHAIGYGDDLVGALGDDRLNGTSGNDRLFGDAGNDTLYGGYGSDQLFGGAGTDTALYDGVAADYAVETRNGVTIVRTLANSLMVDTLIGVERLAFTDQVVTVATEEPPVLNVSGAKVLEGDTGLTQLAFTISLSRAAADPVSFYFNLPLDSQFNAPDFQPVMQTFTLAPGATSMIVTVQVIGDYGAEANEIIKPVIAEVRGAVPGSVTGGTIINDDFTPFFSLDAYRALNPDLIQAFGEDDMALLAHYGRQGRDEGRLASGFDVEAYAASNPDLLAAYGLDAAGLTRHYIDLGRNEARVTTGFDAIAYAAYNPDLYAAFGTDRAALVNHYALSGRNEGRITEGFDVVAYAALNPDLFRAFGLDADALIRHFQYAGRAEGRFSIGFDADIYRAYNPDLLLAFGDDEAALVNHYITLGQAEGRIAALYGGTAAPGQIQQVEAGITDPYAGQWY